MKKNLFFLLCFLSFWQINAQNNPVNQTPANQQQTPKQQVKPTKQVTPQKQSELQNKEKKNSYWSITIEGGLNRFDGDIRQAYNKVIPNAINQISYGGSIEYTLTPVWSMGVEYYYLPLSASANHYSMDTKMHTADYFMAFNFLKAFYKNSKTKWGLWATIGGGMAFYSVDYKTDNNGQGNRNIGGYYGPDNNYNITDGRALTVPVGALIEYNFTKNLAIGTKIQYRAYNKDNLDGRNLFGVTNDFVEMATLQLRWKFGAQNRNHTRNINVTTFNNEMTPSELLALKKKVDDTRKELDSIKPKVEKHDNIIAAVVPVINNYPNLEKRVKKLEDIICPDGPDTDGDGVPDCRDREPNTPSNTPVSFWGESIKSYNDAAGIYFDFDKTDLDGEALKAIRICAEKMMADPSLIVEVRGFTDNMGNVAYNENLSQKRADKVKTELIKNYNINANKIIANGKGKYNPEDKTVPFRPYRTCMLFYSK